MFYSSSGCPETTVNAFETKERQFSQNEIYHTTELCDVENSNCSSFLGKAGFSNIPCVNVRVVAKKQWKMFEQMKKLVFLERSFFFMQLCFLRLRLSEMLICHGLGTLATGTCWLPAPHAKSSPARGAPQRR